MKQRYNPPNQSALGQVFDALFLLGLIYVVLLLPILFGFTAGKIDKTIPENVTWEALGQNSTMQEQWEKLGYTPDKAADIIQARFDYTIKPIPLILTAAVIIGYFVIMLVMSDKEYREVIEEKFD